MYVYGSQGETQKNTLTAGDIAGVKRFTIFNKYKYHFSIKIKARKDFNNLSALYI